MGVRVGLGDASRHFARIVTRVRAQPDADPDFQAGLLGERADIVIAFERGIGANAVGVLGDEVQILRDLRGGGEIFGQGRLAVAKRRVGNRMKSGIRHGNVGGLGPVWPIPACEGGEDEQEKNG